MTPVELLSPAKNFEFGKAAINCGADAIYIGAPKFGARAAVGNSIEDIAKLIQYSHKFKAKVYIALNTLLFNHEFDEAISIVRQLWNAGADALIIQDLGLLEMNLPPIPLFASTQMHNNNWQKVQFLEKVGFQRVILAREMSITEIKEIRQKTKIDLESFVHGAICVSYSGQCYLSYALTGRSGNRGECSQPCRWDFSLKDKNGKTILKNRHLISLKDLNLSDNIEELIEAGISSFKIEGRLKDISYVKNITSFYRQKLDKVLENHKSEFGRSSVGRTIFNFTIDPDKTFNRSYTSYFTKGRQKYLASFATQKSIGKYLGIVKEIHNNYLIIESTESISNGDGLCFMKNNQYLDGFKINLVNGAKLFPNEMPEITIGEKIYRNHDQHFEQMLSSTPILRKIAVSFELTENPDGIILSAIDEENIRTEYLLKGNFSEAKDSRLANENIQKGLAKTGNSIYEVKSIKINLSKNWFLPISNINDLRRKVLLKLDELRNNTYVRQQFVISRNNFPYPDKKLDFRGNVINSYAEKFYKRHGVELIESGLELSNIIQGKVLMTAKYCLKYEMGNCPKLMKNSKEYWNEPVYLENKNTKLKLEFDCKNCEMNLKMG